MSTPAEVVAMAASSVLGAPGEDQMPSKNKPSSESVALGPVSDAAVCNLGRLQAIGGEMEDIGMIPRGRSSANITHDVQVFQVVRGGRLEEMLALLKKHPLVWKTTDSDGCQPLHGDLDVAILDGDPTKRLLLLTVSPLRSGGGGRKTRDGAAARPSWRSGPRPARLHRPASPRSPVPLPLPSLQPAPPPALTPPLPASSRRLLAPLPHQSPQDADLTSPLKTLTSASLAASTGSQVTARDKDGWEPLHYACFHNHLGTAEWLLQAGADVSAASKDGWTPLHAAVPGASLDARSRCDSPFLRQPHDSHHTTVAPQVDAGHVQLSRFLGARGAGGARHRTRARRSRYRVFRDFSAAQPRQRADLRARTNEGNEPLHVAADKGHLELAQWLVRTTKGENVCSRDDDGWQPMHNAAINGHLEVCKWLWGQRGRYPEVRPDTRLRCRVAALLCKCARPPHPSGGPAGYLTTAGNRCMPQPTAAIWT